MKHVAALDGLRAFAVVAVLLFHAQVPYTSGGFLGVSLFFTLSGFLITSLLLAEFDRSGTISLSGFYGRRVRRLLPAAYVCLLAVAACAPWWSDAQLRHLGGDLVASALNVANWRFAFAPSSYQDLFTSAPSPVAHFWSLAIEEQLYLVVPLVVLAALRRGRRSLLVTTLALLGASVAATLLTTDRDLVYNGTHTRAAEVLVGMVLAQLIVSRAVDERRTRWASVAGVSALGAFVALVAMAAVDQDWIYRGGLPAVAVVSATLIWAVMVGGFPTGLLTLGPLVALGRVSYGIYLFHWPVFLLLDAPRTGLDGVVLFALRCVVTGAVTIVVYRLVEQPVRLRRVLDGRIVAPVLGLAATSVIVVAVVVIPTPGLTDGEQLMALGEQRVVEFGPPSGPAPAAAGHEPPTAPQAGPDREVDEPGSRSPASLPDPVPAPQEPTTIAVVGSDRPSATALAEALDGAVVIDATRPDCPLSLAVTPTCASVEESAAAAVAAGADVVVFATGIVEAREALARKELAVTAAEVGVLGEQEEAAVAATTSAIDTAIASGASVIWYTPAHPISIYYRQFQRIAVSRAGMTVLHGPSWELIDETRRVVAARGAASNVPEAVRLLVVGDSTSLYLAQALNDGSDGRVSVLWAGANGCPLVDVESTRVDAGERWVAALCEPYADKLPPIVGEFQPDAVLVMTGPTELAEHRYLDGSHGAAGDEVFERHRDAALMELLAAVGPETPVLVADLPALLPGRFTKGQMTSPERLAAVNAQIDQWAQRHPQVDRFAYREVLEAAEAVQGSLRADGMHADPFPLEALARSTYVDDLLAQVAELQAILRP